MQDVKFNNTANAYDNWRKHLLSMGFTHPLGIELTNELNGNIPELSTISTGFTERITGITSPSRSLAIGQGELLITPIQMANMTATIANRGYYITPHLVKEIEGVESIDPIYTEKHYTTIDSANYGPIVDGMDLVVNGGRRIYRQKCQDRGYYCLWKNRYSRESAWQ